MIGRHLRKAILLCLLFGLVCSINPSTVPAETPAEIDPIWSATVADKDSLWIAGIEMDDQENIYVLEGGRSPTLYKLYALNGTKIWSTPIRNISDEGDLKLSVLDGSVLVGSVFPDLGAEVSAYRCSDGMKVWSNLYPRDPDYYRAYRLGMVCDNGRLFLVFGNDYSKEWCISIFAVSVTDGDVEWERTWGEEDKFEFNGGTVVVDNKLIVVGSYERKDDEYSVIASFSTANGEFIAENVVRSDRYHYLGLTGDPDNFYVYGIFFEIERNRLVLSRVIHKYDPDLNLVWETRYEKIEEIHNREEVIITPQGDFLYCTSGPGPIYDDDDFQFYKYDKEGSLIWSGAWGRNGGYDLADTALIDDQVIACGIRRDYGNDNESVFVARFNISGGSPPVYSTVTGNVYDEGGRKGIAQANVRFNEKTVYTDDDGHFELLLPAGAYEVEVSAEGYDTHTGTVEIKPSTHHEFNYWLGEEQPFTFTVLLGIGIIVSLLVLLAVIFIIYKRKRKSGESKEKQQDKHSKD